MPEPPAAAAPGAPAAPGTRGTVAGRAPATRRGGPLGGAPNGAIGKKGAGYPSTAGAAVLGAPGGPTRILALGAPGGGVARRGPPGIRGRAPAAAGGGGAAPGGGAPPGAIRCSSLWQKVHERLSLGHAPERKRAQGLQTPFACNTTEKCLSLSFLSP